MNSNFTMFKNLDGETVVINRQYVVMIKYQNQHATAIHLSNGNIVFVTAKLNDVTHDITGEL